MWLSHPTLGTSLPFWWAVEALGRWEGYRFGYHGDTSTTFFCGDVDDEARKLVRVTRECLDKAISICAPGVEFKKIGKIIQ
ncbi:Methionine aminopeptidase 1D, chloroplastic/mitochondrial, partial [Cucurbita argyrosperma subsp. argyrosperma]